MLFAAYMGTKQGWAMFWGKTEMLELFGEFFVKGMRSTAFLSSAFKTAP